MGILAENLDLRLPFNGIKARQDVELKLFFLNYLFCIIFFMVSVLCFTTGFFSTTNTFSININLFIQLCNIYIYIYIYYIFL